MNEQKEFLGKSLDLAIAEACSYFDVERGKLEITILEDAKTGIFGIVGARQARITARVAKLPEYIQPISEKPHRQSAYERRKGRTAEAQIEERDSVIEKEDTELFTQQTSVDEIFSPAETGEELKDSVPESESLETSSPDSSPEVKQNDNQNVKMSDQEKEEQDNPDTSFPRLPLAELDQDKLFTNLNTIVSKIISPLLDISPEEVDLNISIENERVKVEVKNGDSGLLIGRDGQNLVAIEYLTARMIAKIMCSQIHIQIDAGEYHLKQEFRLQELAHVLAERVKATGKPQTTRPLSAYQRRVIHMTLQNDPDVFTRSSGEGSLKHIVILRKKPA